MSRIARLTDRALIRVSGPDARPFLQNLLTQDVETLADGDVRYGALLSAPGRLLFDLFLWGEADAVTLDVETDRRDALMQRLAMYRLRAAVEIAADDRAILAAWPGVEGFSADPRLATLGGRGIAPGDLEADASLDDWRRHELAMGVAGPADWPDDRTYPIEANLDLLNGVDFAKGCFVGQETASRMKRRGEIRKRMLTLAFDGAPPAFGAEILNGEMRAGEVRGGVEGMAMALLRLDRLDGELTVDGRAVRVLHPAWMSGQED